MGRLVEDYQCFGYASSEEDPPVDREDFALLFSLLPNLREFMTTTCFHLSPETIESSISTCLNSVSLPIAQIEDISIDFRVAKWVSILPSVQYLELTDWQSHFMVEEEDLDFTFPYIKSLGITGSGVTNQDISIVVNACPSLERLSLYLGTAVYEEEEDLAHLSYDDVLSNSQSRFNNLTNLSLGSCLTDTTLGDSLTNFANLRCLRVDKVGGFPELHQAILKMKNLEELSVDSADYDWNSLSELFTGPTKLASLRKLLLNQVFFWESKRFDPADSTQVSQLATLIEEKEGEEPTVYKRLKGWSMTGVESFSWDGYKEFVKVCLESRVNVRGRVFSSYRVFFSYLLERNNLAMAVAYFNNDFDQIEEARNLAQENGFKLPPFEISSQDPSKLELVKVEMPKLEWFALILKDKEEVSVDVRNEQQNLEEGKEEKAEV